MTRAELKALYVEASLRARTKPQKSEEDLWFREFEYADPRDLKAAIDTHFKGNEWMPKESALKPMVEQSQRARTLRATAQQVQVRRKCEICDVPTMGFNDPNDRRQRYCQGIPQRPYTRGEVCGGNMVEVYREASA